LVSAYQAGFYKHVIVKFIYKNYRSIAIFIVPFNPQQEMPTIVKKILPLNSWDDFFSYAISLPNKEKGDLFEILTKLILTTKPEYTSQLKKVWLLSEGVPTEIRDKLHLPTTDEGIDLVAETFRGEFWAIQCKFKGKNQPPTYKELSTFGQLANNYCHNISLALLVHTGEKGVLKKHLLGENFTQIGLEYWLGLTDEDWQRIHKYIKGQSTRPKPRKPRPHQSNAINKAQHHFLKNDATRGRLIMPCGTGKSLTAFWIANALKAKSVIVAVPSLALIKQSLEDWTREFVALNENPLPEWLVICSDESTAKIEKDEFVSDVYSLGIPTTTDIEKISAFLTEESNGRKIVFTTYQSSDKLAQAARNCNYYFDLAILDEAHKTVGVKSKTFATLLTDDNIKISRRIFMTATERVLRGESEEIFSMDDLDIYGEQFYQLTFKEAINSDPPIISDYKILTITVSNEEIQQLIAKNKLITDDVKKIQQQESQSLAAAIALRKATQKYGIKHAISFHRSIRNASNFSDLHTELNLIKIDDVNLNASHISSKKSAGERARLMKDFAGEELALMTNARCLNEGVDVPAIDCVLFADPKQSVIDIVQAAGRALRPYAGKEYGYIMLPLIVPDGMELAEFTDSTPFKEVARIIAALSTQDERIAEEFRITSFGKQLGGGRIEFTGTVPVGMKLDLTDFAATINAKIWEKVAKVNWRSFEEARAFVHTLKLNSVEEWQKYCLSGTKPDDIPVASDRVYKGSGWSGWGDWLGTGTIATNKREYKSFQDARAFVHRLEIKNGDGWREYANSGKKPEDIPANPRNVYSKQGWKGMGDWLGTGTIATQLIEYRSFDEAKTLVNKLKLQNIDQWRAYCKSGNKPEDIPNNPNIVYKDKGWLNLGDWLGTGSIATFLIEYRPFFEAKTYVRSIELKNLKDWKKFCQSGMKPDDIPANPNRTYSNEGWKGWGDWLGTGTIANSKKQYRSFDEAREYVYKLKLKSGNEWKEFCESENKPNDIPNTPNNVYKRQGWKGMGDWLGTGIIANRDRKYKSFEDARVFMHMIHLKSYREWQEYAKSLRKPDDIPKEPWNVYAQQGWKGMGDWLGTGTISPHLKVYQPFKEARAFVQNLGLKNGDDWREYTKSGKKPEDIPTTPERVYSKQGWIGMGDWLGTGTIAHRLKVYLPFEEARAFVHKLGLKNGDEWQEYCLSGKKPDTIPSRPNQTYKDKGWFNLGDWLGTGFVAPRLIKHRPFKEARAFVQNLGLKNSDEWREYCKSGKKPDDIPSNPAKKYANVGWKGMGDWLGTGFVAPRLIKHRPFKEARAFVQNLGLKNSDEWREYCKSGKKPDDIPSNPAKKYANVGWKGMGDWLGTGTISSQRREYRSFEEARAFVHNLKLKSAKEWIEYCQSGKKPDDIPSKPEKTYKNKGWTNWYDWLGIV